MLKYIHKIVQSIHSAFFFFLVTVGCLACVGCQTVSPESVIERNHRIKNINSKLYDNLQVLLAFARQEDVDLELANKALDGVFMIIGRPDAQEMLLAKCLDEKMVNDLITNSVELKREKSQLVKENDEDQRLLNVRFHRYKESHDTLNQLKWLLGFVALFGGLGWILSSRFKLF